MTSFFSTRNSFRLPLRSHSHLTLQSAERPLRAPTGAQVLRTHKYASQLSQVSNFAQFSMQRCNSTREVAQRCIPNFVFRIGAAGAMSFAGNRPSQASCQEGTHTAGRGATCRGRRHEPVLHPWLHAFSKEYVAHSLSSKAARMRGGICMRRIHSLFPC